MTGRLANKRCLIVGGTTGIGFAAAARFLEEGARPVISGLQVDATAEQLQTLRSRGLIECLSCDATDAGQIERLFADSVALLGGLDVLFHVAGGSGRRFGDGPLHECTDDGWRQTLDLNLTSVFHTNRAAVRYFLGRRQPGVILNLASVLAWSPAPAHFDTIAYTASKGGVIALSRLTAARYATAGIRVNVLAPGLIDTPMATRAVNDPAILEFLRTKQPLTGGPGSPDDCAGAAVFLCGDEARFLTGVVLPIDGGWCVSDAATSFSPLM
jgi:NAD(P)-dependent dehydrogenase (short-subunit alcohol dehydrogenase family)